MGDLDDLEFQKPAAEPEQPTVVLPPPDTGGPRAALWVGGASLAAGALAALLYLGLRGPRKPVVASAAPSAGATPAAAAAASPLDLPSLDGSDPFVRDLVKALSSHPQLGLWLGADDLVRRWTGAIGAVLEDQPPRGYVGFLAPKGGFTVVERRGRSFIDPKSYARYDGFGEVLESLDAAACVRAYRQLEPLFESASRELGVSQGGFTKTLLAAARKLLATPEPQGDVAVKRVVKDVVVYEFADPKLEALSPAQKHLLRLGPENGRKLRAKLREFVAALEPAAS